MKRMAQLLTAVAFALFSSVPATTSAQNSPPMDLESQVNTYLEPYLTTSNYAGSILIAKDGEVLFRSAYGKANVKDDMPNTIGSAYHLASVSRVFTSVGMLLLIQDGKANLQDKIGEHLQGFPNGDRITMEHLVTLSAGFPHVNGLPGYGEWSLVPQTPASLVEYFKDLPLKFEPGSATEHSNSNYNVLALLIERLSGKSYGDFLEERIFKPLGMTHSGHRGDARAQIPKLSVGHTPAGIGDLVDAPWLDWSVKTGNGSIYSTVDDLYRFDRALASGTLVSKKLLDLAFTEHFDNKGYGWFIRERYGDREVYINGRSPGYGSYLGRLENSDLTVIVLCNIYNSVSTDIARALMGIVLGREVTPPSWHARPLPADLTELVVGSYQFGDDFYVPNKVYEITVANDQLMADGDWLMPIEGYQFQHRIYGSTLEFILDESGRVAYVDWDGFKGVPIR